MIDRLQALVSEHAASLAVHDGVPVAVRHVHAATGQLTSLLGQARDLCLREVAPAAKPVPVPEPEEGAPSPALSPKKSLRRAGRSAA